VNIIEYIRIARIPKDYYEASHLIFKIKFLIKVVSASEIVVNNNNTVINLNYNFIRRHLESIHVKLYNNKS
jgi:hypothetical protein